MEDIDSDIKFLKRCHLSRLRCAECRDTRTVMELRPHSTDFYRLHLGKRGEEVTSLQRSHLLGRSRWFSLYNRMRRRRPNTPIFCTWVGGGDVVTCSGKYVSIKISPWSRCKMVLTLYNYRRQYQEQDRGTRPSTAD